MPRMFAVPVSTNEIRSSVTAPAPSVIGNFTHLLLSILSMEAVLEFARIRDSKRSKHKQKKMFFFFFKKGFLCNLHNSNFGQYLTDTQG